MGDSFSISFSSVGGQDTLQVRSVDGGEMDAVWQCPFPAEVIDTLAENAVLGLPAGQRILRPRRPSEPMDPAALGQILFTSLFTSKVAEAWHRGLGRLSGQADQDLTLELSFDPESQRARQLFSLPWELLHDGQGFLVLSRRPLVRRLRVLRPESAPGLPKDHLRMLAVVLSSRDLDTDQEIKNLEELQKRLPTLKVEVRREPTVQAMRGELESGDFHVLHLMGHGSWDPASGTYGLETVRGFCPAGKLAEQLGGQGSKIRLVVLNACSSGRAVLDGCGAADAGLAIELVKHGFLTVIAMQAPVRDQAAIALTESLYRRLASGKNPAEALSSARLDLRAASVEGSLGPGEFATPILLDRVARSIVAAPLPKPEVFLSYAWGDDKTPEGRQRAEAADRLCEELSRDFVVLRDRDAIKPGESISAFIDKLTHGKYVVALVSDKYLRSPYCMFEIYKLYQACQGEKEQLLERVVPVVLPEVKIARLRERRPYLKYWNDEAKAYKAMLRDPRLRLGAASMKEHNLVRDFANHVDEILVFIADVLRPPQVDDFSAVREVLRQKMGLA